MDITEPKSILNKLVGLYSFNIETIHLRSSLYVTPDLVLQLQYKQISMKLQYKAISVKLQTIGLSEFVFS